MNARFAGLTLLLLTVLALLSLVVLAVAEPDDDDDARGDEASTALVEPLFVEPQAGEQHLLFAERNAAGTWAALLAPGSTMAEFASESGLLTQIHGTTVREQDAPAGFRVRALPANHLLHDMGIRQNDVLLSLNGEAFTHPHAVARTFRDQTRPATLTLEYLRDSRRRTLTCHMFYALRGGEQRNLRLVESRTLREVARAHYGYAHFARMLRRANELDIETDEHLEAGTWLTLPAHPALRPAPTQVATDRWIVPASRVGDALASSLATYRALAPEAVALPEGGHGVRLQGEVGAPPYEWGLAKGDVIERINGHPVTDTHRLIEVLGDQVKHRFWEVVVRRGSLEKSARRNVMICVMPAPHLAPEVVAPPPVLAVPEQFGCSVDEQAAAALKGMTLGELGVVADVDAEARVAEAVAWRVTEAQAEYLAHHVRAVLHEAQARPKLARDPQTGEPLGYVGLEFARVESDTLLYRFGLRTGDVLRYVGVAKVPQRSNNDDDDNGDEQDAAPRVESFAPVRSSFELLEQFPLGAAWDHALMLVKRPGTGWVAARLEFVANPEGVGPLGLAPAAGLPAVPGYQRPMPEDAPAQPPEGARQSGPPANDIPPGSSLEFLNEIDPRDIDPELLRELLERAFEEAERERR